MSAARAILKIGLKPGNKIMRGGRYEIFFSPSRPCPGQIVMFNGDVVEEEFAVHLYPSNHMIVVISTEFVNNYGYEFFFTMSGAVITRKEIAKELIMRILDARSGAIMNNFRDDDDILSQETVPDLFRAASAP